MSHSILNVRLEGVAPLVMRNGRMADPVDPLVRELARYTAKRKKSEADHMRIADIEYIGGLWLHEGRPCIPAEALEASICQSAAKRRAKAIYRGAVMVMANAILDYNGPQTVDGLKADPAFVLRRPVAINNRRTIRTRPMFPTWSAEVGIGYLPGHVDRSDLLQILIGAGDVIGVGDHRPRFGRFRVSSLNTAEVDGRLDPGAARQG